MRYTVYTYTRPDGGTEIITYGPLSRALGALRRVLFVVFAIGLMVNVVDGHWSVAEVFLVLVAITFSKSAKRG